MIHAEAAASLASSTATPSSPVSGPDHHASRPGADRTVLSASLQDLTKSTLYLSLYDNVVGHPHATKPTASSMAGRPDRINMEWQQKMLRLNHRDCITALAGVIHPSPMVISGDRSGWIKLLK